MQSLDLLNDVRSGGGLAVLVQDPLLDRAASHHARRMYEERELSHHLGGDLPTRLARVGYAWATCGENIARGQQTAKQAVEDWLVSPGHRGNIVNSTYTGAGFARCNDYWCLILARPIE